MIALKQPDKYCQSCIERGINPPSLAVREWQAGMYYCEDCFDAVMKNLMGIPAAELTLDKDMLPKLGKDGGPILAVIYEKLNIPKELQFESLDHTCRNYDKIFNFHAPALVNQPLEVITKEHEELSIALFHIKYKIETLDAFIKREKERRREEKGLKGVTDNKEEYEKKEKKESKIKQTEKQKLANKMGMSLAEFEEFLKKSRTREFNKMAGNCPECGGAMPCALHIGK